MTSLSLRLISRMTFGSISSIHARSTRLWLPGLSAWDAKCFSTSAHDNFNGPTEGWFLDKPKCDRIILTNADSGENVELAAPWLWSNDSKWVHRTSGQRLKTPADYSGSRISDARIVAAADIFPNEDILLVPPPRGSCHPTGAVYKSKSRQQDENWLLEIHWEDSLESSFYFLSWLMEHATTPKRISRVTSQHALRKGQELCEVDYETLLTDKSVLLDLYTAIFMHGAAIVRDCPNFHDCNDTTPSARVGKLLAGSLSHGSLYGEVFHVQAMPSAHNVAYTTMALAPHQDLSYYESPPGLQLLHCVAQKGVVGGESMLVDGMAAAHVLQQWAPQLFNVLCSTDATFCKQREGADMVAYYPHIQTKPNGEVVSINWSPPFEGPLRDMSIANEYYTAYAAFARLVNKDMPLEHHELPMPLCQVLNEYAEEYTFERLLKEGDMLVFNNRRMLHGRKAFALDGGAGASRHLVGTYTNMDETMSQYRLLMRDLGWNDELLNVGNGTSAYW